MQFFKPENYFEVREALRTGRPTGPDRQRLRLPDPAHAAAGSDRGPAAQDANARFRGEYVHKPAEGKKKPKKKRKQSRSAPGKGYRPKN